MPNWYVLYTKSRNEKIVAERLADKGIESFCPTIKRKRIWSDRIKIVEEPLFRSYCFVCLEEADRSRVFEISGVVRYLFWQKKPAIVRDVEIEAIKALLRDYEHDYIELTTFQISDRVVIESGLFSEKEGTVIENKGDYLLLRISAIGAAIKVKIATNLVKKVRFE